MIDIPENVRTKIKKMRLIFVRIFKTKRGIIFTSEGQSLEKYPKVSSVLTLRELFVVPVVSLLVLRAVLALSLFCLSARYEPDVLFLFALFLSVLCFALFCGALRCLALSARWLRCPALLLFCSALPCQLCSAL